MQVSEKTGTFERLVNVIQFIEQLVTEGDSRHEHIQHDNEHTLGREAEATEMGRRLKCGRYADTMPTGPQDKGNPLLCPLLTFS